MSVYLGNGDGTLRLAVDYTSDLLTYGHGLVVADFNGDGIPDLAASQANHEAIGIAVGVGDGTFQDGGGITDYTYKLDHPDGLVVLDVNRDGKPDLIAVNEPEPGHEGFGVILNTTSPPTIRGVAPMSGGVAGGDVVTIRGVNFSPGATVTFGGVSTSSFWVISDSQISATTPPHTAGTVAITVTNSDGTSATLAGGYAYIQRPGPSLPGVVPSVGPGDGRSSTGSTGGPPDPMPTHR
jgi:hypothetical protein